MPSEASQNEFSGPRLGWGGSCNQCYAQVAVGVVLLSVEANRYRNNPLANGNAIKY